VFYRRACWNDKANLDNTLLPLQAETVK
jgi:hypothetical protein